MPKKIAFLYAGAKHWGGVETYLVQLFENVDRTKIQPVLLSIGQWEICEKLNPKDVTILDSSWHDLGLLRKIAHILESGHYSLIVSQGLVANYYARLAGKKASVPNLITIHSDYKYDYHGLKELLYYLTFRSGEGLTKHYIVVSRFLENEALALGVPKEKISIVYNGVRELPSKKKKMSERVVIGSLGRLHYKKGYQYLIGAMNLLRGHNLELRIYGEGELRTDLEEEVRRSGLTDCVNLAGFESNIEKVLAETDIYVQPSLEEGFGLTVAEAMFAEKPIVATSAGSLPELIADGKTGLIVPSFSSEALAAAIELLLKNPTKAAELAKNARADALARFGIDKWVHDLEDIYLEVAK